MPEEIIPTPPVEEPEQLNTIECAWCEADVPEDGSHVVNDYDCICNVCRERSYTCYDCEWVGHVDDAYVSCYDDTARCNSCHEVHVEREEERRAELEEEVRRSNLIDIEEAPIGTEQMKAELRSIFDALLSGTQRPMFGVPMSRPQPEPQPQRRNSGAVWRDQLPNGRYCIGWTSGDAYTADLSRIATEAGITTDRPMRFAGVSDDHACGGHGPTPVWMMASRELDASIGSPDLLHFCQDNRFRDSNRPIPTDGIYLSLAVRERIMNSVEASQQFINILKSVFPQPQPQPEPQPEPEPEPVSGWVRNLGAVAVGPIEFSNASGIRIAVCTRAYELGMRFGFHTDDCTFRVSTGTIASIPRFDSDSYLSIGSSASTDIEPTPVMLLKSGLRNPRNSGDAERLLEDWIRCQEVHAIYERVVIDNPRNLTIPEEVIGAVNRMQVQGARYVVKFINNEDLQVPSSLVWFASREVLDRMGANVCRLATDKLNAESLVSGDVIYINLSVVEGSPEVLERMVETFNGRSI